MDITVHTDDGSEKILEGVTLAQEPLKQTALYVEGDVSFPSEKQGYSLQKVEDPDAIVIVGTEETVGKINSQYCINYDKLSENNIRAELNSVVEAEQTTDGSVYIEFNTGESHTVEGTLKCSYDQ